MSQYDVANELMKKDSPRKKKRYLLLLQDANRRAEGDLKTFDKVVQTHFKDHILVRMEDPDEALRLIVIKNIDLVVMDSFFIEDMAMRVEYAAEIKKRKKIPILFFCESEEKLIREYRVHMGLYEELDDYVITPVEFVDLAKRAKRMLAGDGRKAKRFQIGSPVEVQALDSPSSIPAVLTDLSLVGAGITWTSEEKMERGTQVRITLPLRKYGIFHPQCGDFVAFSARIMRVSIDGRTLGCVLLHMTTLQSEILTVLLEKVARKRRLFERANAPVVAPPPSNDTGAFSKVKL
jgi:hypothetical protein